MVKKQFTYKKGEGATMDDLDRFLRAMPIDTDRQEAVFTKKCKLTIEYED